MILSHISEAIGNTPMLKIDKSIHWIKNLELYCKLEYMNPFWSLKDRPASYFIDDMKLLPNKSKVIEASSGNTIKALWALASTYWYPSATITNRIKVQEQIDMLRLLGVEVEQVPSDSECINFTDDNNPVQLIEKRCIQDTSWYHTDQYRNPRNTQSHLDTTAKEIVQDLWEVDYFFSGLWTTWSSWAITKALKDKNINLQSVWIVSDTNDFIPWIRNNEEMDEVWIFDRSLYDTIQEVSAIDAVQSTIHLIRKTGMLCWPTSWAIYHWMLNYFSQISLNKPTVAVFLGCDRVENYFSYIKQRAPGIFHQHHKECILAITQQDEQKYYQWIEAETLEKNLDDYLIVDTRWTKSYQLWHITWSINIPFETLNQLIDTWKIFASNKPIVLLCMQWKKTKRMCAFLNKLWYETYNLWGGLQNWRSNEFPFVKFNG